MFNYLAIENTLFTIAMFLYLGAAILFFVLLVLKQEVCGKIANAVMHVTFLVHLAALIVRGIGAGRLPLANQYEFATGFSIGICLCYLIFLYKFKFTALGAFICPVIFLIIGYAAMQSKEVRDLMPALRSNWLVIHVLAAIISYGAFSVSFAVSVLFLYVNKKKQSAQDTFLALHFPSAQKLDLISYRAVALGFLFLTFVMISGAIWAERAWGSYWSWDPKETWSLVTWIIYALYLHMRIRKGVKNNKAALFSIIGFICVIFTYIGVNTFIPGLHAYA